MYAFDNISTVYILLLLLLQRGLLLAMVKSLSFLWREKTQDFFDISMKWNTNYLKKVMSLESFSQQTITFPDLTNGTNGQYNPDHPLLLFLFDDDVCMHVMAYASASFIFF